MGLLSDIFGGLIGGGAEIAATNSANAANAEIANRNNEFNAAQAQVSREYNTQMSNTAYQRATADMKAAGLNPMLAYQQGGASTPSSPTASSSGNPIMQKANMSTAMQTIREMAETKKAVSGANLQDTQAASDIIGRELTKAKTAETVNSANKINLENLKLKTQQTEQQNSQILSQQFNQLLKKMTPVFTQMQNNASSAVRNQQFGAEIMNKVLNIPKIP